MWEIYNELHQYESSNLCCMHFVCGNGAAAFNSKGQESWSSSNKQSSVFLAIGLQLKRETTPILKHTHPHKSGVSLVKQRVKQRVQWARFYWIIDYNFIFKFKIHILGANLWLMDIAKMRSTNTGENSQLEKSSQFFHLFLDCHVSPLMPLDSRGSPGSAVLRSLHKKEVLFMGYHNCALQGSVKLISWKTRPIFRKTTILKRLVPDQVNTMLY